MTSRLRSPRVPRRLRAVATLLAVFALAALAAFASATPTTATTGSTFGDGLQIGGELSLGPGDVVTGELTTVGTVVELRPGALVTGRLTTVGGELRLDGTVAGVVHVYGGDLALGESATVRGDLYADFARVDRAPGAVVTGAYRVGGGPELRFALPGGLEHGAEWAARAARPDPVGMVASALLAGLLAALVAALLPVPLERMRRAASDRPLRTAGVGFALLIALVALIVLLAITLLGIPLALLVGMMLGAASLYGGAALGLEAGRRIAARADASWGAPLAAGVGAAALSLALALLAWVPGLGGVAGFAVGVLGLGAVARTRAGTRDAPRGPARTAPGAPPAPA